MKKIFIIIAILACQKVLCTFREAISLKLDKARSVLNLSVDLTKNTSSMALTIFAESNSIGENNPFGDKNNVAKLFNLAWEDSSYKMPEYLPYEIAKWEDLFYEEQVSHQHCEKYREHLAKSASAWDKWRPSYPFLSSCENLLLSNFLPSFSGDEQYNNLDVLVQVGDQLTDESIVLGIFNKENKILRLAHVFIREFFDDCDKSLFTSYSRSSKNINYLSEKKRILEFAVTNLLSMDDLSVDRLFALNEKDFDVSMIIDSIKTKNVKLSQLDKQNYEANIESVNNFIELPKTARIGALINIIGILKDELNEFDSVCPSTKSHEIFVIANETNEWIDLLKPFYKKSLPNLKIMRVKQSESVELLFNKLADKDSSLSIEKNKSSFLSKDDSFDDFNSDSHLAKRRRLYFSNPCARYYTDYLCDFPRENSFCKVTLVC